MYFLSKVRHELHYMFAIMSLSHLLYLFSFVACVKRLSKSLTAIMLIYLSIIIYHYLADLFRSIPITIATLTMHLVVVSISLIAAGSVWQYGSDDAQQACF
ncbi:unnamed protein product [Anisakis simplex]|uniref:Transmembrane protein 107 n=1 Tax=Anisakis simplex TaxID=6269 RepID=A0A0M3JA10_ANISI|nr:unnamed protein product [Anisakis simplex]VDK27981.1 unnamed protein product [Anisakis simplex]